MSDDRLTEPEDDPVVVSAGLVTVFVTLAELVPTRLPLMSVPFGEKLVLPKSAKPVPVGAVKASGTVGVALSATKILIARGSSGPVVVLSIVTCDDRVPEDEPGKLVLRLRPSTYWQVDPPDGQPAPT
jgi:hypothetical protein